MNLNERIEGDIIRAWSSSKSPDLFEFYLDNTLRYGGTAGSAYGFATYLVTEPPKSDAAEVGYSSAVRDNLYGTNVFEFQISQRKVLIFIYEDFLKTVLGQKTNASFEDFIEVQCQYIGLDLSQDELALIQPASPDDFTSKQAVAFYKIMSRHYYQGRRGNLRTPCDGLEYKGRNDGKVLVIWNSQRLVPVQLSNDNGETWKPVNKDDPRYIAYLKKAGYDPDPSFHLDAHKKAIFDGHWTEEKEQVYRELQKFSTNDYENAQSMSPGILYNIRIHDDKTIDASFKSNLPMVDGYKHYWRLLKDSPLNAFLQKSGYEIGTLDCGLKIGYESDKTSNYTYSLDESIPDEIFPRRVTEGLKLAGAHINRANMRKIATEFGDNTLVLTKCIIEEDIFDNWEVHLTSKASVCDDTELLGKLRDKYEWAKDLKNTAEVENAKINAKLERLQAKIDAAKTEKTRQKYQDEYNELKATLR